MSGAHSRVRATLGVGQVAVAVVLVMAAGLMVRSLIQLYRVDLGFRPERVLTMRMVVMANPADREPPTPARRAMRVDSILDRVRALPLGRGIRRSEDVPGGPGTAVLSYPCGS